MSDWKARWVELNGDDFQDFLNQFDVWQEHWLETHPEDAPPGDAPDELDEFVGEHFQNLDKYLNDSEVIELMQKHNKVVGLDRQQILRAARLQESVRMIFEANEGVSAFMRQSRCLVV